MTERPATTRWRGSATSFGPVGRIAATVVVAWPAWWLLGVNVPALAMSYGVGWLFAAAAWTIFVAPVALRDIWKKVPDREAPGQLILPPERGPVAPGDSIQDRQPPARW